MNPPPSGPKMFVAPTLTITEPRTYCVMTNVRCPNPLVPTPGSICACGTATKDGTQLHSVWAAVLGLGVAIPNSHVTTATQCTNFNQVTGAWSFVGANLVTGVACSVGPLAGNTGTFAVWCAFADDTGTEFPKARDIAALSSNQTNCDGTGASPCGEGIQLAQVGTRTAVALETAPRQYQVQGQPARGPLASLVNTTWLLTLRAGGGSCVWDNGGDGVRLPHVELRPDGVVATEWRLRLAQNGHRIDYVCAARAWDMLGVNELTVAATEDGEGLPPTLAVIPV